MPGKNGQRKPGPLVGRLGAPALALILLDTLELFSPTNVPTAVQPALRHADPIGAVGPPPYLLLATGQQDRSSWNNGYLKGARRKKIRYQGPQTQATLRSHLIHAGRARAMPRDRG